MLSAKIFKNQYSHIFSDLSYSYVTRPLLFFSLYILSDLASVSRTFTEHTSQRQPRWSFSTQNVPGRRNLLFYLHLPKFVCVKAVYRSDKIFSVPLLNSFSL